MHFLQLELGIVKPSLLQRGLSLHMITRSTISLLLLRIVKLQMRQVTRLNREDQRGVDQQRFIICLKRGGGVESMRN
nr:hypothetical protein Iba_chr14cCG12490 [Ipomoea batatas]